jgi:hypothetical protein
MPKVANALTNRNLYRLAQEKKKKENEEREKEARAKTMKKSSNVKHPKSAKGGRRTRRQKH